MARQQAYRYLPFQVTTPINTPQSAPLVTPVSLGMVIVDSFHLTIPKGPGGQAGFRLDYAGATIVPFSTSGTFIISDGYEDDYTLGYEVGLGLSVVTFNAGRFPHTFYARFKVYDLPQPMPAPAQLVTITPASSQPVA